MSFVRELLAALALSFRTSLAQPRHLLLTVAGFLIAAATLLGLLTIPAGMAQLAAHTGLPDVAVVIAAGADAGGMDSAEQRALIGNLPGVAHNSAGNPLVAPQFVVNTRMLRLDGTQADIVLRGISPVTADMMNDMLQLTEGRWFEPGLPELVSGSAATAGFVRLETHAHTRLRQQPWQVTGQFSTGGSLWDSELWMDIGSLQDAWNSPGAVSQTWVGLESPQAFDLFSEALSQNASLQGLAVMRQNDYYRMEIGFIYRYTQLAAWGIAILLGLAAMLAIANALSLALKARRREVAVLRALGFRQSALRVALMLEVVLAAMLCAVVVIALGWLLVDGYSINTATFSQAVQLPLKVSSATAGWTIIYTISLGALAAVWPIRRLLKASLAQSLV